MNQTLWELSPDKSALIHAFKENLPEKYKERLQDLGLDLGQTIRCEKQIPFKGPRVYRIGGSIFSLDSELANHILVRNL